MFLSEKSDEELLQHKVMANGKEIVIGGMKTWQIDKFLDEFSQVDLANISHTELISFGRKVIPTIFAIDEETYREIDIEDWEAIIIQFKEKNKYFLKITSRLGLDKFLKQISERFGKVISKISEIGESQLEENNENNQEDTTNSDQKLAS